MKIFAYIKNKINNEIFYFKSSDINFKEKLIPTMKLHIWKNDFNFSTHEFFIDNKKISEDFYNKNLYTSNKEMGGLCGEYFKQLKNK